MQVKNLLSNSIKQLGSSSGPMIAKNKLINKALYFNLKYKKESMAFLAN